MTGINHHDHTIIFHTHTEMTSNSRQQKRMALRKKLLILRKLTNSKSVKRSSIIMDAFLYILKLKLQLQAMQREYLLLMHQIQNVKVEKLGNGSFLVRVRNCKKDETLLVSILEAFESMGLHVVHSRVTCNYFFGMEAIVEAQQDQAMNHVTQDVTKAVVQAIQKAK